MKKVIFGILLTATFITQTHAQFQYTGQNGRGVTVNGDQVQIGTTINGNQVQLGTNGLQVRTGSGFFSLGSGATTNTGNTSQLSGLIVSASRLIGMMVPVMISLAVLAFFAYLVRFIWKGAEDPKAHAEGMKGMGYSLVALFVMVSIWGIINFIGTTLGVGQGGGISDFKLPGFK
jgi:pSer/pThr/pTyr-binding forkhead associated (FHA) protein